MLHRPHGVVDKMTDILSASGYMRELAALLSGMSRGTIALGSAGMAKHAEALGKCAVLVRRMERALDEAVEESRDAPQRQSFHPRVVIGGRA